MCWTCAEHVVVGGVVDVEPAKPSLSKMASQLIPPFVGKAGPPFDDPNADVVIRSSDGIDFHMFKAHLISASEVLNHLLSSATANEDEHTDGVPIIPIYEPSPLLHGLLLHCNPVGLRKLQDLGLKYEMLGVARALYRNRNPPEYYLTPSPMFHTIRQRMGCDQDR